MKKLLFLVLFVTGMVTAQQMTFELHTGHGLTGVSGGMISADVNNDGIEDVFVYGISNFFPSTYHAQISFGNGNGGFTVAPTQPFSSSHHRVRHAQFIDWDNDGDMDLVVAYDDMTDPEHWLPYISIMLNNGNGVFSELTTIAVAVAWHSYGHIESFDIADFDNDGDLDIFTVVLSQPADIHTRIYRNNGNNFTVITTSFIGGATDSLAFDYDRDGYMDILVTSATETRLYRNLGNLNFQHTASFTGIVLGSILAVGNIDNNPDGYESLILGGETTTVKILEVYHNDGGVFTLQQSLPGVASGKALLADFDNDGWLDLFTVGGFNTPARVFKNNDGAFAITRTFNPGLAGAGAVALDFNGDDKLDIIYSGANNSVNIEIHAWKNTTKMAVDLSIEAMPADWGSVSGGGTFYEGTSVTVSASPFSGYYFASWQDVDGNVLSSDADYTFVIQEDTHVIAVFTDTMGVDGFVADNVTVYPNPVRDVVTIDMPSHIEVSKIMLTDMSGRSINMPVSNRVDMSHVAPGIYILSILSHDTMVSIKIIKQ